MTLVEEFGARYLFTRYIGNHLISGISTFYQQCFMLFRLPSQTPAHLCPHQHIRKEPVLLAIIDWKFLPKKIAALFDHTLFLG